MGSRTCGGALRNTGAARGSDRMWIISRPASTVRETKDHRTHTDIWSHTRAHAHANTHGSTRDIRSRSSVDTRGLEKQEMKFFAAGLEGFCGINWDYFLFFLFDGERHPNLFVGSGRPSLPFTKHVLRRLSVIILMVNFS